MELISIVSKTLLDEGPTLIIEPTKPIDEITGCPFSIPSLSLKPRPSSKFFLTLSLGSGGYFLASTFLHAFRKKVEIRIKLNINTLIGVLDIRFIKYNVIEDIIIQFQKT